MVRQGFNHTDAKRWKTSMGDSIRNRITFEKEPINPQLDILPTSGECKIEIKEIEFWDKTSPGQTATKTMACIYRPDGRCVGTITTERLVILRQLYNSAAESGMHDGMNPTPTSFETELTDLIIRHKPRERTHTCWRIPGIITNVITEHFKTNKERFATPLTVTQSNTEYWSEQPRDQAFGAHIRTYDTQWTGYSQSLPTADAPSLDKAVRWAMWSARHTATPTATVMYLPKGTRIRGNPQYRTWIKDHPELIQQIGSTSGPCPLHKEDQWTQNTDTKHQPSWSMEIIVIWNQPARIALRQGPLHTLGRDLQQAYSEALRHNRAPSRAQLSCPHVQDTQWPPPPPPRTRLSPGPTIPSGKPLQTRC